MTFDYDPPFAAPIDVVPIDLPCHIPECVVGVKGHIVGGAKNNGVAIEYVVGREPFQSPANVKRNPATPLRPKEFQAGASV